MNSLTHFPDPYGSGWHFHRFLGDWYGGAGRERLGDAEFMNRLVATGTPPGIAGIEQVTDRSFADLMLEYATAISLAGTGAPRLPEVGSFCDLRLHGSGRPTPGILLLGRARSLSVARNDQRRRTRRQTLGFAWPLSHDGRRDHRNRRPGLRSSCFATGRGGNPGNQRAEPRRGPTGTHPRSVSAWRLESSQVSAVKASAP